MVNKSRRPHKIPGCRKNSSYASLFSNSSLSNNLSDMKDSQDSRNKQAKQGRDNVRSGRVNNTEFRAAINRKQSDISTPLPRLRSEVLFDSQVNNFLPKYYKQQQRGKIDHPPKSRPVTKVCSQSRGKNKQSYDMVNEKHAQSSSTQAGSIIEGGSTSEKQDKPDTHLDGPPSQENVHPKDQHLPPAEEGKISLADIMIRLNNLADIPGQIREMATDLKQMKALQEQTIKMSKDIKEVQSRVEKMEDKISVIQENEVETQQNQQLLAKEISDLKVEVNRLKQAEPTGKNPQPLPQAEMDFFKAKVDAALRKNNLIIEGIREPQVEKEFTAYNQARYFIRKTLGLGYAEVGMAYRLGKPRSGNSQPRPMLIHFPNLGDRMDAWNARPRSNAREYSYSIKEDLPKELRPIQAALQRVAQVARRQPQKYSNVLIRDFKIHINDTSYGINELENLPKDLRPSVSSTPGNQQVVIFFGKDSRFSNHYHSKFEIHGITYSSIEQYLAEKRAILADRQDLKEKAMASDDPVEAKRILNALHGDRSDEEWENQRRDILFDGLMAKFVQNDDLRQYLLSTQKRTLGEASRNKTWGIGLTLADNGRLNPRNWSGENLLGTTLMEVRDRLTELNQPTNPPTVEETATEPAATTGD